MKILVVVTDTNMGGVTTAAINFCNELSNRGNDVYFLDLSMLYTCAETLNVHVHLGRLTGSSRYWNLGQANLQRAKGFTRLGLGCLGAVKKATIKSGLWYKAIFKRYKEFGTYDVAIAFRQCAPCYSFVLNNVAAKKKIGFVHGELKYMRDISSWKKYMVRFDKIAYVSQAVQNEFVSAFPELEINACTIYNMFNQAQILRMAQEKNPITFDRNFKNIVTVARIDNAFKRIDLIPEICKYIIEKTSTKFHWYIIGDGPDFNTVQQKIETLHLENVITLCGANSNPYSIVKAADFSVLLSKSEAYPMTVIESLILKKPIVVTNFASVAEMIEDGKHGWVSGFSKEDLAAQILRILDEKEILQDCVRCLSKYEFSNDKAYQQFLGAIE